MASVLRALHLVKANQALAEDPQHEFVADWKQLFPFIDLISYLWSYDLRVFKSGGFLIKRAIPIQNVVQEENVQPSFIPEVTSLIRDGPNRFFNPSNFKEVGFGDDSSWSSTDGRVRYYYTGNDKIDDFSKFRIMSLGVLRLANLIDNFEFEKQLLITIKSYNGIVISYDVQERTFIYIKLVDT